MQASQYRRIPVFGLLRMGWRDGIFAGIILTAAITAACGCFGPAAAQTAQASPLCGGEELARGTISRVIDGRTFVLGDGREVRLAAIEVPPLQAPQSSRPDSGTPRMSVRSARSTFGMCGPRVALAPRCSAS